MFDLNLFSDIAFVEDSLPVKSVTEPNKALSVQPRVKTKKQEFLDAVNHGVNNKTVEEDDKFFSPEQVKKITWYKGANKTQPYVNDGIEIYRFENWRGYQIQICNNKDNGLPFQHGHCLIACVKWRNVGVTRVWQTLGVIQQNKTGVLIFKSTEISKLKPTDMSVLLSMLRFRFALVPNQAIADNCLLRLGDNPVNYSVFSLDEMQAYLGVTLQVNENPSKPYRVLEDNRKQHSAKQQPKANVQFKIMGNDELRRSLKREQQQKQKLKQQNEALRERVNKVHDENVHLRFRDQ